MPEPIFISSYDPKTKQIRARLHESARSQPKPWHWPLAKVGSRTPMILSEHGDTERRGVDLGYPFAPFDSELYVPVYAAQAGEVAFAAQGNDAFTVTIDHGDLATCYRQLSQMFVTRSLGRTRRRQYVRAGEVIGYAAKTPLRCRFELWRWTDDRGFVAIDPVPYLKEWPIPGPDISERLRAAYPDRENEAA
jgi:murein DD-endopeptidase MepM/ murein hydrolase activator NlpD